MKTKADRTNQDYDTLINNIYIELSMLAKKILINRLKNHIYLQNNKTYLHFRIFVLKFMKCVMF